jgi:hypothetical protein
MSFLNPFFLFALIAIGLPLLIHLLNLRRPQKVAFSTLAFFQELKKTTIRRIRIKKLLLLILRLAAIACFALVLARPFLPPGLSWGGNASAPSLNAVLLDNSISMSRIGKQGPLFEYGKNVIEKIEASSKEDDRFMFQVTNGGGEMTSILSRANLLNALNEAEIKTSGNYLLNRLQGLIESVQEAPYQNKNIYVITDAQQSQLSALKELESEEISLSVIDVGSVEVQNTAISDISSSTNMIGANIPFTLNVEVTNNSELPAVNQFVSVEFEGQMAGQYPVSLQAGESKIFNFEITPSSTGPAQGLINIEGDEFQSDNTYYFSFQVPETRNILWVKESTSTSGFNSYTGTMLRAAGESDAQLDYQVASPGIFETVNLADFDALILDGIETVPEFAFNAVQDFVQSGGGLLFFPSENGNLNNYNRFLSGFNAGKYSGIQGEFASFNSIASADDLLENHPAFSGLFERDEDEQLIFTSPDIYYYIKFVTSGSGTGFNLLSLNNDDVLVHEKQFGDGALIISVIGNDPGWSNFPVKPLYAPFYYRILLYTASSGQTGFVHHELGNNFSWRGNIDGENAVIRIGEQEIKPATSVVSSGTRLQYTAEDWTPGWITITDGEQEFVVAANLNRDESDFSEITEAELENQLENIKINRTDASALNEEELQNEIMASGFGKEIWNWFMFAGFLFLIAETLVSMWYKTDTLS